MVAAQRQGRQHFGSMVSMMVRTRTTQRRLESQYVRQARFGSLTHMACMTTTMTMTMTMMTATYLSSTRRTRRLQRYVRLSHSSCARTFRDRLVRCRRRWGEVAGPTNRSMGSITLPRSTRMRVRMRMRYVRMSISTGRMLVPFITGFGGRRRNGRRRRRSTKQRTKYIGVNVPGASGGQGRLETVGARSRGEN